MTSGSNSMADKASSPDTSDPQLHLKKRARRRLVGATALALLAVIVLPMVMDQEAKPPTQDIQIRIPSQDPASNAFSSRIASTQPDIAKTSADASTSRPSASNASALANPSANSPVTPTPAQPPAAAMSVSKISANASNVTSTTSTTSTSNAPSAASTSNAPAPHGADKPSTGKAETSPSSQEKAVAEKPKADESAHTTTAVAPSSNEHWIIQLGAYQEHGNVKVLQAKIKELGYRSYTEKIDTANGARTRVRAGPFADRASAEKAQERLKKIGAGGPAGGTLAPIKQP